METDGSIIMVSDPPFYAGFVSKFHFLEFVDFFFELAKTAANDAIQPPKDKTKDKRKSFFRIR